MVLEEGQVANYLVIAIKQIEEDGDTFFILQHPNGGKFLLPHQPYKDYNIIVGKEINCRIDKINCSGKIFLEPMHPFYKESQEYDFRVISSAPVTLPTGELVETVIVADCFGNKIEVFTTEIDLSIKLLKCKIDYILKGKLHLSTVENKPKSIKTLEEGSYYKFKIIAEIGLENRPYFVVEAPDRTKHFINSRPYKKYGLKVGVTFVGVVSKLSKKGLFLIEPNHPVYMIGSVYLFKVVEVVSYTREEDFKQISRVLVIDTFNEKTAVEWPINKSYPELDSHIECRVIGFRKGKVVLHQGKVD